MNRHKILTTAAAAVDLLLRVGPESFTQKFLDDLTSNTSVSPLAGTVFQTRLLESMCVGSSYPPANMHVLLRLGMDDCLIEAYCLVTCQDHDPREIDVSLYVDGEFVLHRKVAVKPDGTLRPEGMPPELRFADPGFQPLVCETCNATIMRTVQQGMYFTCEFADRVAGQRRATINYGRTPIPRLTVMHLGDGGHAVF